MDLIEMINGLYQEFSEIYYLKINKKVNYVKKDMEQGALINSIKQKIVEYYDAGGYFKALKRLFSWMLLKDKDPNRKLYRFG